MIVIIDGYNLLKRLCAATHVPVSDRERILSAAARRARERGYEVYVVLDGGSSPLRTRETRGAMTIFEVGYSRAADAYIQELAEGLRHGLVVVVTADRALAAQVQRRGLYVVDPGVYWNVITQAGRPAPSQSAPSVCQLREYGADAALDIHELMEQAAAQVTGPKEGDDDERRTRVRSSHRLTRAERTWKSVIDRL